MLVLICSEKPVDNAQYPINHYNGITTLFNDYSSFDIYYNRIRDIINTAIQNKDLDLTFVFTDEYDDIDLSLRDAIMATHEQNTIMDINLIIKKCGVLYNRICNNELVEYDAIEFSDNEND